MAPTQKTKPKRSSTPEAEALLKKLKSDPIWYLRYAFGSEFWLKQVQIIASVRDNKNTSVKSCHASGKTWTASRVVLWFLQAHPQSIVITTAPTWRQVKDMMWKEINAAIESSPYKFPGNPTTTQYKIADDWYAVGLSTNDPNKFQGYHAKYILVVLDESSGIPAPIRQAIEAVASTGYVRILELGNPTDPTGGFADTFKSEFYNTFSISCFDTPNFQPFTVRRGSGRIDTPASIEKLLASSAAERDAAIKHNYLISPQWVYERAIKWGPDSPMFLARCLGEFPLEAEDTLIALRWALAAKEGEYNGDTTCCLGVDVARFGSDDTVFVARAGNSVNYLKRYSKMSTMETAGKIINFMRANPYYNVNIDDSGVGGGVTDRVREVMEQGEFPYFGTVTAVNVGEGAYDKEQFVNKRAEFYWHLRVLFENGQIVIPDDDDLVGELTSMKVKWSSSGKIQIESKDDMKKRGISSPDSADGLMLAYAPTSIGKIPDDHDERPRQSLEPGDIRPRGAMIASGLLDKQF